MNEKNKNLPNHAGGFVSFGATSQDFIYIETMSGLVFQQIIQAASLDIFWSPMNRPRSQHYQTTCFFKGYFDTFIYDNDNNTNITEW